MLPGGVLVSLVAAALAIFGGCGDDDDGAAVPATTPTASITPDRARGPRVEDVQRTVEDLAGRLNVATSTIDVVEQCGITWPDGSAGVREPGMVYTPVIVEGWLLILGRAGAEYRYHGAGDRFIAADFVAGAVVDTVRCP
jgi:hypothetical protein